MSEPTSASTESQREPDLSGRELGDYRLLRRLGRGGMADVYLAEQHSLRRQIAFKVLKSRLATDERYVLRFHHEARAAAALVHANIVQIHEVGEIDGVHFIAQEYIQGQNLRQVVAQRGTLDAALTATVMRQVAGALHKAAEQGIIHRDIKPENIMLTPDGQVKVADFGLARVEGDAAVNLTQVGVTMGTPLYMSPEQAEGGRVDPRSDIYSLGVTSYHMLAGRPPFDGETALAVAMQHVKNTPERLEIIRPDLPGSLARIIHKTLAKKPEDRFQSAAELLQDLRAIKVEGLEENWSELFEDFGSGEMFALGDARMDATWQLDTLMKTQAHRLRIGRRRWRLILAGVAAAFLLGGVVAFLATAPIFGNASAADATPVEKKPTAEAQYVHAVMLNAAGPDRRAWESVEKYHPDETEFVIRASQQLARLDLEAGEDGDLSRAMVTFDELAQLDDSQASLRAFGIAGQALVHDRRHEADLAARRVRQLMEQNLLRHLDPAMAKDIGAAAKRCRIDLTER